MGVPIIDFKTMSYVKEFEHLKIQLKDLKSATNDFAEESCIGKGGFGKVYKGNISSFGRHVVVALKRLDRRLGQGDPEFWKEIMMLSLYKHENIAPLIGFCDDNGEKILVYEFVPNKSLDLHLNSDKLTWIVRLKICIGAARGLAYLHSGVGTQQRVLHRDIKSSNILLDDDMSAKISDFGLSKVGPANQQYTFLFSNPVGTLGYCDPLYVKNGFLTKESDVYSFGVVLFEVLCGRLCIDYRNASQPLVELARKSYEQNTINEIIYSGIKNEINPKSLQVFATIAYQCLKRDREERPLMSNIVKELETALRYQELKDHQVASSYLVPKPSEMIESDLRRDAQPLDTKEYDSEFGGFLVVTIHEGNYMSTKNTSVLLRVEHDIRRTTKIEKNQYPIWKQTFKFTLEKPAKATLHLVLISYPLWYERNRVKDTIGDVDISVAEVVKEKHINKMYDFGDCKILVELQWEPSALPVKTKPKFLQFMGSVYNMTFHEGS